MIGAPVPLPVGVPLPTSPHIQNYNGNNLYSKPASLVGLRKQAKKGSGKRTPFARAKPTPVVELRKVGKKGLGKKVHFSAPVSPVKEKPNAARSQLGKKSVETMKEGGKQVKFPPFRQQAGSTKDVATKEVFTKDVATKDTGRSRKDKGMDGDMGKR